MTLMGEKSIWLDTNFDVSLRRVRRTRPTGFRFLFCVLLGTVLSAFAGEPPAVQARASIRWTRTICREDGRYIGWPTVCRLKNGELLAVFSGDRDAHVCPWGKVQLIRSTDEGETWSKPVTIANGPIDDRDAGVVQLPNGDVVVTWFTSMAWAANKKNAAWQRHLEKIDPKVIADAMGNFLIRSTDNGHTWSKPQKLSGYEQTPHGPIVLKDGSLLQIGRRSTRPDAGARDRFEKTIVTVAKSVDGGRSWKVLCPEIPAMAGENDKPSRFHEPHVAELADGTLVGLVRYHGTEGEGARPGNGYMRTTFSQDGGRTWTPMKATPLLGLPPHLLTLDDGKLLCVYGRRLGRPGFGEFACLSDDGGRTWDVAHEIVLKPAANGDLGYPATCKLANGDLLTVYYQQEAPGGKTVLMATKWRVTK